MAETKAAAGDGAASRPSTAASASTATSSGSGNVDKKALKENFEAFAKFGDKERYGNHCQ